MLKLLYARRESAVNQSIEDVLYPNLSVQVRRAIVEKSARFPSTFTKKQRRQIVSLFRIERGFSTHGKLS
ncbi:MAG: hypothetical protein WBY75_05250, partial [Terracidiphilus sp.]